VAVAFSLGLAAQVRAGEAEDKAVLDAFQKGVTSYQTGEYAQARASFDQVLAAKPGLQVALKMRDMAELGEFVKMKENPQLAEAADKILDLMTRAVRQRKRTVENADQLLKELQSPELTVYGKARAELVGHGPYAVPYVVGLLSLKEAQSQTVVARTVSLLVDLQRDACLPLIRVLRCTDDPLVQTRVADVLGQIGDVRALPALMAASEGPGSSAQLKDAVAGAVKAISGKEPAELGTATEQYVRLGNAYFNADTAVVGYTWGLTADVWQWNPAGADMAQKVVYEEVPNYLYFQRMAAEVALEGLSAAPGSADLRAVLAAALVRQMALCEYFKVADVGLDGEQLAAEVKAEAAKRAADFEVQVPVALRLLAAPVLGQALEMTLAANDGRAALYLARTLGDKLASSGPGALDESTGAAVVAALDCGDKDVRYNAAIALVTADPSGTRVPAQQVMDVMSAALKAASDRNVLVIMDNFQMRNKLVKVLRAEGVATTECGALEPFIESALSLEPSVDAVFLTAGIPAARFERVTSLLKNDARTKAAPLYVIAMPAKDGPNLQEYTGMAALLSTDDLRTEKIQPIVQGKILAESRSIFTEQEEALVLKAVTAVSRVDPLTTQYALGLLEPSLIKALTGYTEQVSLGAVASLAAFGGEASVRPLADLVAGKGSLDLRLAACRAAGAVLKRTGTPASPEVLSVLKAALTGSEQPLREAAAGALSGAGLSDEDLVSLVRKDALGR
jgi:HEAT repeat protein